jgi:hypothetical protein
MNFFEVKLIEIKKTIYLAKSFLSVFNLLDLSKFVLNK